MKKNILSIVFVASFSFILLDSCKKEPEQTPTNNTTSVDSCAGVTYNGTIKPLIDVNCTNTCHKAGAAASNINLTTFVDVKTSTQNGLIATIKHLSGVQAMPSGRAKLADSTIKKFDCWVSKGYPEN